MTAGRLSALTYIALTLVACNTGSLPLATATAPSRSPTAGLSATQGWMSPNVKREDLLYVGSFGLKAGVAVYDYHTGQLVGQLTGFLNPDGMCVDAAGDVWITSSGTSQVVEYAHGSSDPMQTLSTDSDPVGCSVSPKGDLAVTNYMATRRFSTVQVWKKATGTPTTYTLPDACYFLWPPGYDNKGNLYVQSQSRVCELPAGRAGLRIVAFDRDIGYPLGAMWDGQFMTLGDKRYNGNHVEAIYRVARTKNGGLKTVGITVLQEAPYETDGGGQPFIVGTRNTPINTGPSKVVVDYYSSYTKGRAWVEYYHYKNGAPIRSISSYYNATGQAVSLAER